MCLSEFIDCEGEGELDESREKYIGLESYTAPLRRATPISSICEEQAASNCNTRRSTLHLLQRPFILSTLIAH